MELIKQQDNAIEFCNNNLIECCTELLEWKHTGVLRDGKIRELCKMLDSTGQFPIALAEEFVKTAAMERLVSANA